MNMPIYEYKCQACNIKFEVRRGFSESSGASCPQCQCPAQRIFSPVPIVFKGPGFYVTDNASSGRNAANGCGDEEWPPQKAAEPEAARGKDAEKAPAAEPSGTKAAEVKA